MLWDMTCNLVICACAFMALGIRRLVVGARREARWRQGGGGQAPGAPPSNWRRSMKACPGGLRGVRGPEEDVPCSASA